MNKVFWETIRCKIIFIFMITVQVCIGESLTVFITIDTEGTYGKTPFENLIIGQLDCYSDHYGAPKIMDLCERYELRATFFVDVYEYRVHGIDKMAALVQQIDKRGHDVELHTHPGQSIDPILKPTVKKEYYLSGDDNKLWIKDYTIEEQAVIIQEGISLLQQWIHSTPIAHRAGNYAANYNTLKALIKNNIPIDASMFYQNPMCDLNKPLLTINTMKRYNDNGQFIDEIPISCYIEKTEIDIGPVHFNVPGETISKLDIDSASLEEIISGLEKFYSAGVPTASLFLHSYSFVNHEPGFSSFWPDTLDIQKFKAVMDYLVHDSRFNVMTFRDFYNKKLSTTDRAIVSKECLPIWSNKTTYAMLVKSIFDIQQLKKSRKTQVFIFLHLMVICLILFSVCKRKKNLKDFS